MKKVFYFISAIAVMAMVCSCNNEKGKKITEPEGVDAYRITMVADSWDNWVYTYDKDGKLVNVNRDEGDRVWDIAYNGNVASFTGRDEFTITFNDKGLAESMDFQGAYTFTYDAKGYLTSSKLDGELKTAIEIDANGNIVKITEGEDVYTFTYGTTKNVAGAQLQYNEEYQNIIPQWYRFLMETGWFGKASAYCPTAMLKNGEKLYDYSYQYDDNGCVASMTTMWSWDEECIHTFEWETYKK